MRNLARQIWNATPISWRASHIGRFLAACYRLPNNDWYDLKSHCALLARTVRLLLVATGLPLKRQYLVLRCREGSQSIGLFAEFTTVLGALEHYERWSRQYAGLRVDFATQGLYYDAAFGANWWQYYFEPIDIGCREDAVTSVVSPLRSDLFSIQGERLSRKRGFEIIDRYIRPRPHLGDEVESYVRKHFQDAFVVGIHYRGTDKHEEAPVVPYERVRAAILDAVISANTVRHKLFLATDEQAFLDYMLVEFPDVLTYRRTFRSVDGKPTHWRDIDNHNKGADAVLDCLLLSRCQHLIRTASNLSLCSTLINPDIPEIVLNREYFK